MILFFTASQPRLDTRVMEASEEEKLLSLKDRAPWRPLLDEEKRGKEIGKKMINRVVCHENVMITKA